MRKKIRGFALVVAAFAMAMAPMAPAGAVAGASYTTINPADGPGTCFNGPGVVNCNIYDTKQHVWLNGGPTNGTSQLSDGTYFFVVGEPGGENDSINDLGGVPDKNLSDDYDPYTNRIFTVVNHHITGTSGSHVFDSGKLQLFPYSDTTNPGGEYFVGICRIGAVDVVPADYAYPADPAQCKYDNFKVKAGNVVEFGTISGLKYYDANTNGKWDGGEVGIQNWPIDFTDGVANTLFTDAQGQFSVNLSPDTYTFQEELANGPWVQTGNTTDQSSGGIVSLANFMYTVQLANNDAVSGLNFGNVCLGAGGGLTLGFWSNNNGRAVMNDGGTLAPELALLSSLNLRNAAGANFDPTTYAAFRTWLLSATATNMAYMLSAQLAAMELNVEAGFVNGGALIYAPGTTSANVNGFATVSDVMNEANTELGIHGLTKDGSPYRSYQQALKNALDRANNNLNFVRPGPSSCPAPVFPS